MIKQIEQYLIENVEVAKEVAREVNSWNGYLEHLDVYDNDKEFFNTYFQDNPLGAVRITFYGDYHFMHDYVRFDGNGNIESMSAREYDELIIDHADEIAEALLENIGDVHIHDEGLKELVKEL